MPSWPHIGPPETTLIHMFITRFAISVVGWTRFRSSIVILIFCCFLYFYFFVWFCAYCLLLGMMTPFSFIVLKIISIVITNISEGKKSVVIQWPFGNSRLRMMMMLVMMMMQGSVMTLSRLWVGRLLFLPTRTHVSYVYFHRIHLIPPFFWFWGLWLFDLVKFRIKNFARLVLIRQVVFIAAT